MFARIGTAYSHQTHEKMVSYTDDQILELIQKDYADQSVIILAPIIKSRKGHYRDLFKNLARQGFLKVRVDGVIVELTSGMKLDRYKTHDIELVIDRLRISNSVSGIKRLHESLITAMYQGGDTLLIFDEVSRKIRYFSRNLMCPSSGIAYPKPEPQHFLIQFSKGNVSGLQRTWDSTNHQSK